MGKTTKNILIALLLTAVSACGGGGGFTDGGNTGPEISSLSVLTDNPQLQSSNTAEGVTITAIVKDASNNLVADVLVTFSATSGALQITQGTTDASGTATALLTNGGNTLNRTITVTASAQGKSDSVAVEVTGTQLTINGPSALTIDDTGTYTILLQDSAGTGIANQAVTVTSANGNALSSSNLNTDTSGQVQVTMTGTTGGTDTLTASAFGLTKQFTVSVSTDNFVINPPAAGTKVPLSTSQAITLHYDIIGTPQVGRTINFSTTRGTLTAASGVTDSSGNVTIYVSSTSAGPAIITATTANGPSTSVQISFIATNPASLDLQADPSSVSVNGQSTITAVVRDPSNNLVEDSLVNFTLTDVSGGSLSAGSAVTDSQGKATIVYTAGSSTSAQNGVSITAQATGGSNPQDTVTLTVAGQTLRITLGTGNEIIEPNTTQYKAPYVVQVTDANGAPAAGVIVQLSVLPRFYSKGYWEVQGLKWVQIHTVAPPYCANEDVNANGIKDTGEDFNNNGILDPGNPATVTPSSITTDSQGFGFIDVVYPQEMAQWVQVRLSARAQVSGSEFIESRTFFLPILASDLALDVTPPGVVSPFGKENSCANPN